MSKILLISGHGQGDPGAQGGGHNEAHTMRQLTNKIKALIPGLVDVYDQTKDAYQQNALAYTTYTNVIEFHMDGAANLEAHGGHVIIKAGFSPDALDVALKNAIASKIGLWAGTPTGFSYRNDLGNLNTAAARGISYRLLELGFITNAGDRTKAIANMDSLAKALAEAISGKAVAPGPTPGGVTMYKALPVKSDGSKSKACVDEFGITNGKLRARGWHIGNYSYQYLFIMDAATNTELARVNAKGKPRPDVNKAYSTKGDVGFDEQFDAARFKGKKVWLKLRCTNDPKGNNAGGSSDVDYPQYPVTIAK